MQKETWLQLVLLIYHSILSKAASVQQDRKSTRLNSSNGYISYAVFCLKKKMQIATQMKAGISGEQDDRRRMAGLMVRRHPACAAALCRRRHVELLASCSRDLRTVLPG